MPAPLLDQCTIVDLTTQLPGPYCSMLLADLGARVIKVEPPGGDPLRTFPPMFASVNRGKQSVGVDLKTEAGRAVLGRLFAQADIVLEGFRPGVAARLGADYSAARNVKPDIVYCAISGFGQGGPYRLRAGHDINYQALGGLLGQADRSGGKPAAPAALIADLASGLYAAVAVLTCLLHRNRTGEGQFVDLSMTDSILSWIGPEIAGAACGAIPAERPFLSRLPHYDVFRTSCGGCISVGIVYETHFWQRLCDVTGLTLWRNLTTEERLAASPEIRARLAEVFQTATRAEWDRRLQAADIPCGPVYALDELPDDPQFRFRESFFDLPGPGVAAYRQVRPPYRFSQSPVSTPAPPPEPGEHTRQILRESGYAPEEIDILIKQRIVEAWDGES